MYFHSSSNTWIETVNFVTLQLVLSLTILIPRTYMYYGLEQSVLDNVLIKMFVERGVGG